MRQVSFYKYHGAGNDFILVDNLNEEYSFITLDFINKVCDRHFGIGSDGFIFINKHDKYDFDMQFHNPDGSQSFCGNGARCAVAFYSFLTKRKGHFNFSAFDGLHSAELLENGMVRLKMNDVSKLIQHSDSSFELNTGSPHLILIEPTIDTINVKQEGAKIRYSEKYNKEGINVNFVQAKEPNKLVIRTYERGVEDETLACGTGITAAALTYAKNVNLSGFQRIQVNALGGEIFVDVQVEENRFSKIVLEGPASFVFKGEMDV
jgi:diaminopimelate epimerase